MSERSHHKPVNELRFLKGGFETIGRQREESVRMTTQITRRAEPSRARGAAAPSRVIRHQTLVLVAFGAVVALTAWLRIPAVARDTLWAEDGRNFLQGAVNNGPLNSLFIPYAGYLHTIPRMIAASVVGLLPISDWALGMTAGSCVVAGIVAVTVFVASRGIIGWLPARIAIASLTVLAPLAPREVLGNTANLHSLLLWALFWIALSRPRTRASVVGLSLVALLGALTEVQSLFLLPLLLFRPRDRRRWPVRAMLLLGVVVQVAVTLAFPRSPSGHSPDDPLSIVYGYLINAVMPLGVPQAAIGSILDATGPGVGILILIALAGAAALGMRRGTTTERVVVMALALGSVVIFCTSVVANPNIFYDYADMSPQQLAAAWLTRYGVVPSMMLASIPLISLGVAVETRRRNRNGLGDGRKVVLAVLSGLLLVSVVVQFFPQYTRRSSGPEWRPQLAAASESCETLPAGSRVLLLETLGWHVAAPCSRLRNDRPHPLR
jgi:hypothetical protein